MARTSRPVASGQSPRQVSLHQVFEKYLECSSAWARHTIVGFAALNTQRLAVSPARTRRNDVGPRWLGESSLRPALLRKLTASVNR